MKEGMGVEEVARKHDVILYTVFKWLRMAVQGEER
jgi:transposase-like protein